MAAGVVAVAGTDAMSAAARSVLVFAVILVCARCGAAHAPVPLSEPMAMPGGGSDGGGGGGSSGGGSM